MGGLSMNRAILAIVAICVVAGGAAGQTEKDPPVIAKMEELGTVYLTRRDLPGKGKAKDQPTVRKNVITGVDFRPMAGSDKKKVAAVVKELATLPDLDTV